jgi:hydroxysqualene dehydroxylase
MHVHVIGAGLAGLSSALRLAERRCPVTVYEAAPRAGGRCRSFHDDRLDRVIDNGNHLLLGANDAALSYLKATGGRAAIAELAPARFPFLDLASGARWAIRPNAGRFPWWIFSPARRVAGTRALDYLSVLRLRYPPASATVADCVDPHSRLGETFWSPLVVSVMNADLEHAAAAPMAEMLRRTFGRGEAACRPLIALDGLSAALVEPALARLDERGVAYRDGWRLVHIEKEPGRVTALVFDAGRVELGPEDRVVLAVPHYAAAELLPGLIVPEGSSPIVNAHFRVPPGTDLMGAPPLLGLINATAQWVIVRGDIVSVTVSAAETIVDMTNDLLLAVLWADVARALKLAADPLPPGRIVKEKRATFAQTPQNQARRPPPVTAWRNLVLAGDWTATGLPATIESAITSGNAAAQALLSASPL